MNDRPDLDEFRKDWLQEINKKKEKPLELFSRAAESERNGDISEAVKLYRKALRADESVELKFHQLVLEQEEKREIDVRGPEFTPSLVEQEGWSLFELPIEIIIQIFKWTIYFELPMVTNLALVSKKSNSLLQSNVIWKFLSEKAHEHSKDELSNILVDFNHNYLCLWKTLPQLRQDGVYISKVTYIRPGYNAEAFVQPVHLITYFRYIRFLRNNRCVLLTSNDSPDVVIPTLSNQKGLISTRWSWNSQNTILVEWPDKKIPSLIFSAVFEIRKTKNGFFNKINWLSYCTYELSAPEETRYNFSSPHMKPFIFSRVRRFRDMVVINHAENN